MTEFDALVVGSGPNGLSAAIRLAERGLSTCVIERQSHAGGGLHSLELDEPGFIHDECSAIHPMGVLSPYLRTLDLHEHGLVWKTGQSSVAHPLDARPAVILKRDLELTCERLGVADGRAWRGMFSPLIADGQALLEDLLAPLKFPRALYAALRFGWLAHRSAHGLLRSRFTDEPARALFAGLAGHSVLPLEFRLTAAFGLIFGLTAHLQDWPCAEGGSVAIARALLSKFKQLGGVVRLGHEVRSLAELPPSRLILLDVTPASVAELGQGVLPERFCQRLRRYVYGPGTFKLDFTLSGPIPWSDPEVNGASTVHVGGTHQEIAASERAAWRGDAPHAPYLIVCQQSEMDRTRAPGNLHTGYAYCHVPHGYPHDVSPLIEAQIERFAPGFRDQIRTRRVTSPRDFHTLNPNFVGGAVTGGAATWDQIFTRPLWQWRPYSTPHPRVFMCSAATPPGGGVHGMCGYYAAEAALATLR